MSWSCKDTGLYSRSLYLFWATMGFLVLAIALAVEGHGRASLLGLMVVGGFLLILILTSWSSPGAFIGFFAWIHLEDLARLVTHNFQIFFVKDFLLAALFVSFCLDRRRRALSLPPNPMVVPILVYGSFVLLQCFNPRIPDPRIPFVGLHSKLLYIPLFFISMAYFDSERKIRSFLTFLVVAVTGESLLALVQYFQDPSWWYRMMNLSEKAEVIIFREYTVGGGLLRTGSIFNNPGRFTQFIIVVSTLLVGSQALFRPRPSSSALWYIGLTTIFAGGVFLQSSRAVFYLFCLSSVAILVLHGRSLKNKLQALALLLVLIGVTHHLSTYVDTRIGVFYVESLDPTFKEYDSIGGRINRGFGQLDSSIRRSGLLGHGTGTSSLGRQYVHRPNSSRGLEGKENGYAALIWELGLLGPLFWILLMGTLLLRGWQAYGRVRETNYGKLAFALVVMIALAFVLQFIGMQYLENYLVVTHFWAFAGLLFSLERIAGGRVAGRK